MTISSHINVENVALNSNGKVFSHARIITLQKRRLTDYILRIHEKKKKFVCHHSSMFKDI